MSKKGYLGIDWGGTVLKSGVVTAGGELVRKETVSSRRLAEPDSLFKYVARLLDRFQRYRVAGIGIGAPGILDPRRGQIYSLPNVPGWERYPLKARLERRFSLPVFVENDVNLFALAEVRVGAARGKDRVLYLTLGTGLGGAVIWDGEILEGKTSALEVGHVPFSPKGRRCGCGAVGCIETYVGNKYLLQRYNRMNKAHPAQDVKEIYQRAMRKESQALALWDTFAVHLGKFLRGMMNIFNPQMVVLAGGVSGAFRLFRPKVLSVIRQEAMWPHLEDFTLVRSKLKDGGIRGAGIMVAEKLAARGGGR
ncbi:MAG: ROK family protein [Candidatus Omnitrophica bacterium]|nr:ROK family protein [Candidatus Omnitrophota bacterium]